MDTFLTVTDIFLLLFWVRLWSLPDRELYFNPLLSAPTRMIDQVLDFLRPVLPISGRLTSLLLLLFLLTFRAVTINHLFPEAPWVITIGEIINFSPRAPGVNGALIFSALHFLFFIARFWGVYVLIQLMTPVLRRDRASEAFHFAALPLSVLRRWAQVFLLLTVHGLLVYELTLVGVLSNPLHSASEHANRLLAGLIFCSVADLLKMAWQLMFSLLVGSFVASMLQSVALLTICNEAVSTMLGTRKRFVVGLLDLTPLLYMFSVYLLYTTVLPTILLSFMDKIQ